jgi:adenylate cyclase
VTRASSLPVFIRRLRLASGLVLFAYLLTHFVNHTLGLVSLAALETGRGWFLALWRNPLGTLLLFGALGLHLLLALWSLYRRRTLRMPAWEATQLALGLAIPPLLVSHVIGTRVAHAWFDVTDSYTRVVLTLWELRPENGLRQALLLTIAWLHGCVGVHFWLRLRPGYRRVVAVLFAGALLVPVLALLGFAAAGQEVSALARQPGWVEATMRATDPRTPAERESLDRLRNAISWGFVASVGIVLAARAGRELAQRHRRRLVRVMYPGDRHVAVPIGSSVLEASRSAGIPHASVCGGRGRCSTCRVRIVRGFELVPPASAEELRVLKRVGAPPNVRLACQLRPSSDLSVTPLLPATARASDGLARPGYLAGDEQEIAVLFADLRGFTTLAEHKLPFDVVFFLNRYFEAVGGAIQRAGGITNQFMGDGVMALFGVNAGPEEGCRRALAAAGEIVESLTELSRALADELSAPLRVGIGVHTGPAVVGRMGYGEAVYLTAVGDTVHVASRLQELTKQYACQLVISEHVAVRAGLDATAYAHHDLTVRNRRDPLTICVIPEVRSLVTR